MAEFTITDREFWQFPIRVGSGLWSAPNYDWQWGLRYIAENVKNAAFDPSMSGFDGIDKTVKGVLEVGHKRIVSIGHSNYNYYSTELARRLKPHRVEVVIVCIDRTMKDCPPLGSNVPAALDMWAGRPMKRLVPGSDFQGKLVQLEYLAENHFSIIKNMEVLNKAIEFANEWKEI